MRVNRALYLFPVPAVALMIVFFAIPLVQSFQYAITDWDGYSPTFNYIGVDNFIRAFTNDTLFVNALTNNVKFLLVVVIFQTALALMLAVFLSRNSKINVFLRALFFFPTILSSVSVGFIWKFIYDPNSGLGNTVLRSVGLGDFSGSYLGDQATAIYWVALTQVWFHAGQMMVIYIAGLQGIPRELYEAAEMDGAGKWQQFTKITWPLVAPATTIVMAYTMIQAFSAFDLILGLVGNPPKYGVDILSTRIYTTFANYDYGYATTQSIIFVILIGVMVFLQRRGVALSQKQS
jgi:raffinose/stachyose/melibiose transport system permease protein